MTSAVFAHAGEVNSAVTTDHTNVSPRATFCGFSSEASNPSGVMTLKAGNVPTAAST